MSKFEVGVSAVIFDDQERILLGHRRDLDLWGLPGGGVESGELPTEGVIRETREETGLEVEIVSLLGIGVDPYSLLGFVFNCRVVGGKLTPTNETDAVAFFAYSELPAMISPRTQAVIERAYQHSTEVWFGHITQTPTRQWYAEQAGKKTP
jgi:ADP-ribose pyrophosphatase YjhB (NUDIX family)